MPWEPRRFEKVWNSTSQYLAFSHEVCKGGENDRRSRRSSPDPRLKWQLQELSHL